MCNGMVRENFIEEEIFEYRFEAMREGVVLIVGGRVF